MTSQAAIMKAQAAARAAMDNPNRTLQRPLHAYLEAIIAGSLDAAHPTGAPSEVVIAEAAEDGHVAFTIAIKQRGHHKELYRAAELKLLVGLVNDGYFGDATAHRIDYMEQVRALRRFEREPRETTNVVDVEQMNAARVAADEEAHEAALKSDISTAMPPLGESTIPVPVGWCSKLLVPPSATSGVEYAAALAVRQGASPGALYFSRQLTSHLQEAMRHFGFSELQTSNAKIDITRRDTKGFSFVALFGRDPNQDLMHLQGHARSLEEVVALVNEHALPPGKYQVNYARGMRAVEEAVALLRKGHDSGNDGRY